MERHDGTAFLSLNDAPRVREAGKPLHWRSATLFLKQDLMEFGPVLGLPGHASHTQSCAWCHCTVDTRDDASRYSAIDPPNARKTDADYDAACRACEIDVLLDHGTFIRVRALLEYDKRADGARGRALTMDVGPHLLKGDRLEPTATLPDVSLFDTLTPPCTVRFWRRSSETLAQHRRPLFSEETGISVDRSVCPDSLHVLSLGCILDILRLLFNAAFQWDVYEVGGYQEQRITLSTNRLQFYLFAWYAADARAGRDVSRVQALAP